MDFLLLRTFREVARQGSITDAARSLGYTQSAVSRQVATLEANTGARLLDRRARGVELTEHGRTLLPHAEALLARLGAARHDLEAVGQLDGGHLRVGAFPTANAALIPLAMADFASTYPNVSLSLIEGTTRRQLGRLEAADVDLAVISAFPDQKLNSERFELTHLLDDVMLVALHPSHRLASRESLRLAELAGESWIAAEARDDSRALSPLRLEPESEPRIDFAVGEWTAKLGLVAAGLGITLVPSLAAAATRSDIALASLRADERSMRRVYAATAKGRTRPPATEAFAEILRQRARAISDNARLSAAIRQPAWSEPSTAAFPAGCGRQA
jgi:DNA-binding transcriptional LysR family regulator